MWKESKEYVVKGVSNVSKAVQLLIDPGVPFIFEPYPDDIYRLLVKDEGQPVHSLLLALCTGSK